METFFRKVETSAVLKQTSRLDILLVYQKFYIYHCRVLEKNLDFNEFINKISLQWKLQNCNIAYVRLKYNVMFVK